MLTDLEDSHGATDLSEINIEDLDFNINGEGFEYASTDTPTINEQLEAAPEVSHQLSHLQLTDFACTRPLPGFSTSIPNFFLCNQCIFLPLWYRQMLANSSPVGGTSRGGIQCWKG